ncbi:type II toxin-antitoxin system RelE/ParE family toxin [Methylomonas sp. LL1]|uniref:type II toxin-antitoxin system RelE/ParE family toxin n=1 Tax=Methylomonas sp. LL1 TaxID=2785785 RepID=UPI0018C4054D|nr:type II toxin-antitoxin system RelE/ParE family toxin [Methylomonas sp. LL1]QPK63514.1 type II toxin-antitoxin system RelE/ParE family toxin [Methylomonas sp. LL1]
MALRLIWSPEAVEDLNSIAEYIAKDSVFYARSVVRKVLAIVKQVPNSPQVGRIVPEIGSSNIRERFVYSYRVVYKIDELQITIVAVIHGKRLLENISDRFN